MERQNSLSQFIRYHYYNDFFVFLNTRYNDVKNDYDNCTSFLRRVDYIEIDEFDISNIIILSGDKDEIRLKVIISVDFTAFQNDYEEFSISKNIQEDITLNCLLYLSPESSNLIIEEEQLQLYSKETIESDYSDSLIPEISDDEYDRIAEDFLSKYYPEALKKPCIVNAETIAEAMGLKIEEGQLSLENNLLGKCVFIDGNCLLYDPDTDEATEKQVKTGTIMIDPYANNIFDSYRSYNNTLIHECVHWELHRQAFFLISLLDTDNKEWGCKNDGTINCLSNNQILTAEDQAVSLSYRIQMPYKTFKSRAEELVSAQSSSGLMRFNIIERAIDQLSEEFGVSKQAAKLRMIEVGFREARGCYNYMDRVRVSSYYIDSDFPDNKTYLISYGDALEEIGNDLTYMDSQNGKTYLYVDSHFVLNEPKYVYKRNNIMQLTDYAKMNMSTCCLTFSKKQSEVETPIDKLAYKYSLDNKQYDQLYEASFGCESIDICDKNSNIKEQNGILTKTDQNNVILDSLDDIAKMLEYLPRGIGAALHYVKDWRNKQITEFNKPKFRYSNLTNDYFTNFTPISSTTVTYAFGDDSNPKSLKTIIWLCIAMHLPYLVSIEIIRTLEESFKPGNKEHTKCNFILQHYSYSSIDKITELLKNEKVSFMFKKESKIGTQF